MITNVKNCYIVMTDWLLSQIDKYFPSDKYFSSTSVGITATVTACAVSYYVFFVKGRKKTLWTSAVPLADVIQEVNSKGDGGNYEVIKFNENEIGPMLLIPSVACVTHYKGKAPVKYLQERVNSILKSNPWLKTRILKTKRGIVGVYPKEQLSSTDDNSTYFSFSNDSQFSKLSLDMGYEEMSKLLMPLICKIGNNALNSDEQVFNVVVVEIEKSTAQEDGRYALVMSLCHVMGDGHTFYQLYSMLNDDNDQQFCGKQNLPSCYSLSVKRDEQFSKDVRRVQGDGLHDWALSLYFLIGMLLVAFQQPAQMSAYMLNNCWVEQQKKKVQENIENSTLPPSISFVSTNDLVTAWVSKLCRSEYLLMAINFRNKLEGYTDIMAGNYESLLLYNKPYAWDAYRIREPISNKSYRCKNERIPAVLETLKGHGIIVSNWASFYKEIILPNSKQIAHMPLLPTTRFDLLFHDAAFIYRPSKESLAVLFATRSVSKHDLAKENALGDFIL